MAEFFKKIIQKVQKNKDIDEKDFAAETSQKDNNDIGSIEHVNEVSSDLAGTLAQRAYSESEGQIPLRSRRKDEFFEMINQGYQGPKEYDGLTKSKAKEELEKRISEKLSLNIDDDNMLARIHEEKERQRQELSRQSEKRHRRRERKLAEQKKMEPVMVEDAIIAVYEEPENELLIEETKVEPQESVPCEIQKEEQIEGQITILDINNEIQRQKEQEEREAEPDLIETPYIEVIKSDELASEKAYNIVKKTCKHCNAFVRGFFAKLFEKFFSKKPEKEAELKTKRENITGKLIAFKNKVIDFEKRTSAKMVYAINRFDKKNDQFVVKAEKAAKRSEIKAHRTREWIDVHKRILLLGFSGIVALVIIVIGTLNYLSAYEYAYNGKTLGMVKEQEDVLKILEVVSEQLTKEHNAEIFINKEEDIAFKKVWNIGGNIDTKEDVLRRLTYMQDMSVKGYGIFVEDTWIATLESEKMAKEVLEAVMSVYAPQSATIEYEDVDFAENIEILPIDTKLGFLSSKDDVIYKILTGAEEQKVHIVNSGETFSGIAKQYGLSQADLQASNPTVSPERLSIGQEIVLTQAVPLLTVQTVEIASYVEYLPFDTIYEDNASIYIGESSTKKKGENGERSVTAKIVRNNGVEIAKLELQSSITKEPVTAIIYKGTKELPPKKGTGTFSYPVSNYTLTSKFGQRWGRMHYGIDLAAPTGTKIRASDGGTVTYSGYKGSYGYVVMIDHGGGFVTVYAHCSKLYVKVGEQVYKGQHIANVGSTGRSTGPHCHFEIQYLGVQKNPLNYL